MDSRVERGCPNPPSQMIPPLKIPSLPHTIGHIQPWMWTFIAGHQGNIFCILLPGKKHRHALGSPTLDCTGGGRKNWGSKTDLCTGPGGSWHGGRGGQNRSFSDPFGIPAREGGIPARGVLDPCTGAFWIPARGLFGSLHGEFLRCKGSILDLV